MRKLLFRAWTGAGMEYDIIVGKFGAFFVNKGTKGDGLDEKDSASLTPFNTIYSKETPIMQNTGLLDKNGKEIYEGDIVSVIYGKKRVSRETEVFTVYWKENSTGYYPFCRIRKEAKEFEIIGNIYENPELLK